MIKVYLTDASFFDDDIKFKKAVSLLPAYQQKAVSYMRVREKQNLSVAAHSLARRVMSEKGIAGEIKKDDNGRPFVEGNPFYISISHSGTLAVFSLSDNPLGVDIEKNRSEIPGAVKMFDDKIRNSIKTPADFMKYWTRYEAYIKCRKPEVCFYKTVSYENYTLSVCSEKPVSHLDICPCTFMPSDFSQDITNNGV